MNNLTSPFPFISEWDWTTNTDFSPSTDIHFKVGNNVTDTYFDFLNLGISSKNYTFQIRVKIGNDMGTASGEKDVNIQIISLCSKVNITNPDGNYIVHHTYHIRNETQK